MKKYFTIFCLLCIFVCISYLFWYSDWKYSLPTPVPLAYHVVIEGDHIDLKGKFNPGKNKPLFLHFFNPDCPCSRFNMPHFKSLADKYGEQINFAVVVMTSNKSYTTEKIQEKYGLAIPVLSDTSLAASCGVYSTPQAVLLNKDLTLYYRGNYNRTRYCTDQKSNYAQIAIDSLLGNKEEPLFNEYALKAYGCSLPGCEK